MRSSAALHFSPRSPHNSRSWFQLFSLLAFLAFQVVPGAAVALQPIVMRTRIAVVLMTLLSATGCQTLGSLAGIENPEYSIRSIRPQVALGFPLSSSAIDFDILLEVQNPNSIGLTLDRIDFDLLVDDRRIVQGFANEGIRIPAEGIGDVRLEARVGYNELRGLWEEVVDAVRGGRPDYEIRGTAYYDTPLGSLQLPFDVRQRF